MRVVELALGRCIAFMAPKLGHQINAHILPMLLKNSVLNRGKGFAVDASLISADVQKQSSSHQDKWDATTIDPKNAPRAVREYLDTLDEEAFGAATPVKPKFTAHADPASQRTAARKGPAFFAYSDNYLIDTYHGIIMDVEATRSVRQAEVGATLTMLDRTAKRFDLRPDWLVADTAYGSEESLVELVLKRQILPFIPVIDKGERTDGTLSRSDFTWDDENDRYICPEGKDLRHARRNYSDLDRISTEMKPRRYRATKAECQACTLKAQCCPNSDTRSLQRGKYEVVRDFARSCVASSFNETAQKRRKKVEMLFAHLKRILGLTRLRLRGPSGVKDEFTLAATAQNLRKLAKLCPTTAPSAPIGSENRSGGFSKWRTFSENARRAKTKSRSPWSFSTASSHSSRSRQNREHRDQLPIQPT